MKVIWKSIKGDYLPAISLAQFLLSTGAAVYTFLEDSSQRLASGFQTVN